MEHPAEQPRQARRLQIRRVVVAALHHRQRGFTDGEYITRLEHGAGVVAQHLGWIVEGAEQMGADRQHRAAITLAPVGGIWIGGCGAAQRDQHAITLLEAAEGAVVGPEDLQPEGVNQLAQITASRTADADAHLGLGGFVPFHDVGEPVAIGPGLFIRVLRLEAGCHLHIGQIGAPQQGGVELDLRHEHLHAGMGIADRDRAFHLQALVALALHAPIGAAQPQWRGRPQPMACLKPQQCQPENQGGDQQHSQQCRQRQCFEFCGSVELAAEKAA